MRIEAEQLKRHTTTIFAAVGCSDAEAVRVGEHLVDANLYGHDSHGVIRIASYVRWIQDGKILPNQQLEVVFENEVLAVVDGRSGLGQSIGEQAVELGIAKCGQFGVSVVALRNSGHLGRIGDWPLMAAQRNLVSLHFVNTTGAGMLVAPFGGIDRRLSANPIAAGVPVAGGEPIMLDISACTIAEGKIRVALNKGVPVPDNCIIDSNGQPTNDPKVFYAEPPGAILPIAGHKGYGLSLIVEMLAGAMTGGGCTNPENASRVINGMFSIYFDPDRPQTGQNFTAEVRRFIDFVKSSRKVAPDGQILMPGEIEIQTRAERLRDGIELDATTWRQIRETAESLGVADGFPPLAE